MFEHVRAFLLGIYILCEIEVRRLEKGYIRFEFWLCFFGNMNFHVCICLTTKFYSLYVSVGCNFNLISLLAFGEILSSIIDNE